MVKVMRFVAGCAAVALAGAPLALGSTAADGAPSAQAPRHQVQQRPARPGLPGGFKHLVVIYEENHSFDNLYGGWGSVNGQRVNGRSRATAALNISERRSAARTRLRNSRIENGLVM